MNDSYVFWVVMCTALLLVLAGVSVRVALEHERVVVTRFGRLVRVGGPGLVLRWPALEGFTTVSLQPVELPVVVHATTRDGVDVHLLAHAVCRITDPARTCRTAQDPMAATADALDRVLVKVVTQADLSELVHRDACADSSVLASATSITSTWGVEVTELVVSDIDARLTSAMLRQTNRLLTVEDGGLAPRRDR